MQYYLIQAYNKQEDKNYHTHKYPSYLTSYDMKMGGENFGLQSGLYDALKFISLEEAIRWKEYGEKTFVSKEFDIVPIDSRILGRVNPQYVIK